MIKSTLRFANSHTDEKQIYQLKYSVYIILFVFSSIDSLNTVFQNYWGQFLSSVGLCR